MKANRLFISIAAAALIAAAVNITGIEARENFVRGYFGSDSTAVSTPSAPDSSSVTDTAAMPASDSAGRNTDSTAAGQDSTSFGTDSTAAVPTGADTLKTGADTSKRAITDSSHIYAPPVDSARLMRDTLGRPMRDSIGRFIDTLGRSIDSLGRSLDSLGMPVSTRRQLTKAEIRMYRRDSIRAVKDSIIQNTPRILETYVFPDSLWYKRILTWTHDRDFNNVRPFKLDTTYNYHYYDLPFMHDDVDGIYLGVSGSPVMRTNYFKREKEEDARFFDYYLPYTYTPESLPMYNTKTPYVELQYTGTLLANRDKEEANIKILATQNITPELNIMLEYHRYGGKGILLHEDTDNRTAVIAGNYTGKNYLMHAGYIFNRTKKSENGGIRDSHLITDTLVEPKEISVWLNSASSETRKNTVFIDQSLRIPFTFIDKIKEKRRLKRYADSLGISVDSLKHSLAVADTLAAGDSTATGSDTSGMNTSLAGIGAAISDSSALAQSDSLGLNENITTAFIGMSNEYSVYRRAYRDEIALSDAEQRGFYNNAFYLHPTTTNDSMRVAKFDNKIYLRLQPWAADAIVSKIDAGVGYKLSQYYLFEEKDYITGPSSTTFNTFYVYAGAQGTYKKYFNWDAFAKYNFAGYANNDLDIKANLEFSFYPFKDKSSPISLTASFSQSLKEPWFYEQHYSSNHYRWSNNFGKRSETKIEGYLDIPKYKMRAFFGYSLIANDIYYDTLGIVRQHNEPISVMTAFLQKDFRLWKFHFDNRILFQLSSNTDVLPLPMLALNLRYYLEFPVVKNVMTIQAGAEGTFTTKWYSPAYNPALGVYQSQNKEMIGGKDPYINVFINIQWKRACIFLKVLNVGENKHGSDYFATYGYIRNPMTFKMGIFWPFYTQPYKKVPKSEYMPPKDE